MSVEIIKHIEPGTALIKSEYLISDHVRQLNSKFITSKDHTSASKTEQSEIKEPPKKKLKGQNKHRPREKKQPRSEKLCFSTNDNTICRFAENCPYIHDVPTYLKSKLPDIGKTCYAYEKYGKCRYGFTCRFGSQHIVDNKNIVNEELYEKLKNEEIVLNTFSKDLQFHLRKRTYNFQKTNQVLDILKQVRDYRESQPENLRSNINVFNFDNLKNKDKIVLTKTEENSEIICNKNELVKAEYLNDNYVKVNQREIKKIDFSDKLYLAPLTTVGNLPFRRICKEFGADITCSEMALASSLLQGNLSEWALIKRHPSEDIFGVQLCGAHADTMTRCSQVLVENMSIDFIDINMGCPLDNIFRQGAGSGLMNRIRKLEEIIYGISSATSIPLTLKMRTGIYARENIAQNLIQKLHDWHDPVQLITLHGRSREQRYTKSANWEYISECGVLANPIPLFGSGDVLSFEDYNLRKQTPGVSGIMIARGALIKPWIFKEIKEQKHWDISSTERFDILKKYVNYGLEHWGSDTEGVEKTRRFLLEWLSFLHRYIPVGVLEKVPQCINERPPLYCGRNDLETLMCSSSCANWIKISEMLLGPVPENFTFLPKHKANAYQ